MSVRSRDGLSLDGKRRLGALDRDFGKATKTMGVEGEGCGRRAGLVSHLRGEDEEDRAAIGEAGKPTWEKPLTAGTCSGRK